MNHLIFAAGVVGLLLLAATPVSSQAPSRAEIERLTTDLKQSLQTLEKEIKGLTEAQWSFKPAANRWSVADCVEHLALAEAAIQENVQSSLRAELPAGVEVAALRPKDEVIRRLATDRTSQKFQAPEVIRPTGKSSQESLEMLRGMRQANLSAAHSNAAKLHSHVAEHPLLKTLDTYQWLLLAASHMQRHTQQVLEVKADAKFPRN